LTGFHHEPSSSNGRRILYYVDPMHPAYRSDKPGIAPDCGMALEPIYEGSTNSSAQSPVPPGGVALSVERQQLIGIRVAVATRSSGLRTIRSTGRVVPQDGRLFRIQAGFEGWVNTLQDTPPGTLVKRDQVLATLYGPEIRSAESNYLGFMAGIDRLRQGMTGAELKSLDDSKHVNEEQLRLLGMGADEIAHLENSHHVSSSLDLVAPGDGIILSRSISPRQRFERGAELYRIADLSKVWIIADAHGSESYFRPGTRVRVNVPELSRTLDAIVTTTLPLFDEATRTLKVRLEADNPGLFLRPDMFVDVEFQTQVPPGLSIPADAVLDSGMRKIVYAETSDGIFEPRPVEISGVFGDQVIIARGVNEGDRIVVSGNFLLDSESRMRSATISAETNGAGEPAFQKIALGSATSAQQREVRDSVCGMMLKPDAALRESYQGKTFSFCSESCRKKFLENPSKYARKMAETSAIATGLADHRHD
jgi:YHS domain-containing protein